MESGAQLAWSCGSGARTGKFAEACLDVNNDSSSSLYDASLDATAGVAGGRPVGLPAEQVPAHQRLLVNPLWPVLCALSAVALIQHSLRTRNVLLFCASLGVLLLSPLLAQFYCRDCGASAWLVHANTHACDAVEERYLRGAPTPAGISTRTQILLWVYVLAFGLMAWLVWRIAGI